jgi:hypothetical protein
MAAGAFSRKDRSCKAGSRHRLFNPALSLDRPQVSEGAVVISILSMALAATAPAGQGETIVLVHDISPRGHRVDYESACGSTLFECGIAMGRRRRAGSIT